VKAKLGIRRLDKLPLARRKQGNALSNVTADGFGKLEITPEVTRLGVQ
jgi:hypothetical protein